jgi:hypothetical protein
MSAVRRTFWALAGCLLVAIALASPAAAEPGTWQSEQPIPPGSSWPVGLGHVGDIEFYAPNRGLLITAGAPPTIAPGVWAYDGQHWHPYASVCGATDGRIAWAGPDEFWTVSDGRPGQTGITQGSGEIAAPLANNTLCHFVDGQVAGSYAHPAFEPDSYREMHGAACLLPNDCWFAGNPLEAPQIGAFQLHWNGTALEAEPYPGEGHEIADLRAFEGRLYESALIAAGDRVAVSSALAPALHAINPEGVSPMFEPEDEGGLGLPLYAAGELPRALEALRLSAADGILWGAAGRKASEAVEGGHTPGQVTVAVREGGSWVQIVGPKHPLPPVLPGESGVENTLLGGEAHNARVSAIAAEPGGGAAWVGLAAPTESPGTRAVIAKVSVEGQLLEERTLPSSQEQEEGIGPKGAAQALSCPAPGDCWLVTTQGWLFHLAPEGERTLPRDEDANFNGPITFRPPDQGLPQIPPDAPPADTSGLVEEQPSLKTVPETKNTEAKVELPLLSHVTSKLIHGSTLQLSFHLAVKARVRLIAKRHGKTVAQTPRRTLGAGKHVLTLALDPRRWPTKLDLQTHALAPLPLVSSVTGEGATIGTESTSLHELVPTPAWQTPGTGWPR